MTTVTPLFQPPIEDLRNALQVCMAYADTDTVAPESAQQQLGRVKQLIQSALGKLAEPANVTVEVVMRMVGLGDAKFTEREARDIAAVVTHTALSWNDGRNL